MTNRINWNGGDCPIKSDETRVEVRLNNDTIKITQYARFLRWDWIHARNSGETIAAYRITEDHEPKMTREQITAQIDALQKQLDAMPVVVLRMHWDGQYFTEGKHVGDTHYFDVETINGAPHIHGVAMKEVGK